MIGSAKFPPPSHTSDLPLGWGKGGECLEESSRIRFTAEPAFRAAWPRGDAQFACAGPLPPRFQKWVQRLAGRPSLANGPRQDFQLGRECQPAEGHRTRARGGEQRRLGKLLSDKRG